MTKREEKCPGCGTRDLTCGERDAGICYDCRRWIRQKKEFCRQLADARETNRRLNRRCQAYEAALAEKIDRARAEYRNLGRMLANAAAVKAEAKAKRLRDLWLSPGQDEWPGGTVTDALRASGNYLQGSAGEFGYAHGNILLRLATAAEKILNEEEAEVKPACPETIPEPQPDEPKPPKGCVVKESSDRPKPDADEETGGG